MNLICPYCNSNVKLENSLKIYGKDYGLVYICEKYPVCDSYVGCHPGSKKPLGRLADKQLRIWKSNAHAYFDWLWKKKIKKEKCSKRYARTKAYSWLSKQLNIDPKDCHIGMFDIELCKRVIEICKPYIKTKLR